MRISQLKSLTQDELNLLLYIVNVVEPFHSKIKINGNMLLCINHDALTWMVAKQEPKMTDEGKFVFKSLMLKLNKNHIQDLIYDMTPSQYQQLDLPMSYEYTTESVFKQSELSFG